MPRIKSRQQSIQQSSRLAKTTWVVTLFVYWVPAGSGITMLTLTDSLTLNREASCSREACLGMSETQVTRAGRLTTFTMADRRHVDR